MVATVRWSSSETSREEESPPPPQRFGEMKQSIRGRTSEGEWVEKRDCAAAGAAAAAQKEIEQGAEQDGDGL